MRLLNIQDKDFLKHVDGSYKLSIKFTDSIIISSGIQSSIKDVVDIVIDKMNFKGEVIWEVWKNKEDDNIFKYQAYGPVQNIFKKGRGQVTRDLQDWRARNLASYSLREREVLNLVYVEK